MAIKYVSDGTQYEARVKTTICSCCGKTIRSKDGEIQRRFDLHLLHDHKPEDYGLTDGTDGTPLFKSEDEILGGMSV